MSMFGNIAVEIEMKKLLELMDRLADEGDDRSPVEQLRLLRKEIEAVRDAANSGWL